MARVEKFSEVILDFAGVEAIGQAFADEVFRVWTASHPETDIRVANANPAVARMIQHVSGDAA